MTTATKTTHTPGPWTTNRTNDASRGRSIGTSEGAIALLVTDGAFTASEQTANARLIAAGPELLERLECLVALIEQGDLIPEHNNERYTMDEVSAARAAIAKATGE